MKIIFQISLFLLFANNIVSQNNNTKTNSSIYQDLSNNPIAPAKAAFYSAILPGLGQAYNKKYWKIPVIYGAIGTSVYFYKQNNNNYQRFLDALKLELAGKPHEFENLDETGLEKGINTYKKQRDLALFITIGLYVLNILEANVDAHLPDKKLDDTLSLRPSIFTIPETNQISYGLTFNINL